MTLNMILEGPDLTWLKNPNSSSKRIRLWPKNIVSLKSPQTFLKPETWSLLCKEHYQSDICCPCQQPGGYLAKRIIVQYCYPKRIDLKVITPNHVPTVKIKSVMKLITEKDQIRCLSEAVNLLTWRDMYKTEWAWRSVNHNLFSLIFVELRFAASLKKYCLIFWKMSISITFNFDALLLYSWAYVS